MLPNPCPCTNPGCGAKLVAIAQMVLSGISVAFSVFVLHALGGSKEFVAQSNNTKLVVVINISRPFYIVSTICESLVFLFAIGLFLGVVAKKAGICWAWIGFTTIYEIINISTNIYLLLSAYFVSSEMSTQYNGYYSLILRACLIAYFVYVVYVYIRHLKAEQNGQLQDNMEQSQGQPQASIGGIPPVVSYTDYNADQQA